VYAKPNLSKARSQYQTLDLASRVESLGPHGLVALLYTELLHSLDVMAVTLRKGHDLASDKHTRRAQSILVALSGSLDFERGGSVTTALSSVYGAMNAQLREIISTNDTAKLAALRDGVITISTAWEQLA
jgi:flagellar secretion chaperone FliS